MADSKTSALSRRTRTGRSLALAGLAGRASLRGAAAKLVPGPGRRERSERAMLRTSEDIAAVMGDMKGVAMKLGQIMSLMTGTVSPEFAGQLEGLQSSAPPMSPDLVRSVFVDELGSSPDRLFRRFEWEPFAAASIGQVHRAELHDRTPVAVKVQYPGVREAVSADLANLGLLFGFAGVAARGLDPRPLVADLRAGIEGELDYRREAAHQERFRELYDGHPFVRVPRVFHDLSTDRVLVQQFMTGERFAAARSWPQADRDRLGEILFRFTFGTMHRYGLFQADPHPGNYLLLDDGTVAFVDYGCVAEFEPGLRIQLNDMIAGVVSDDLERWRSGMEAVGYVPKDLELPTAELWEHMKVYYTFIRNDGQAFTPELAAEMVRQNVALTGDTGKVNRKLNIPQGLVFTQRINFGFTGLLAGIGASGPWHSIMREYVLGEAPCSELGRRSAAFRPGAGI